MPGFWALPKVARTLLKNTYGKLGALLIYEWSFSTYQKAVFANTVVAAAYVGADFSSAKFEGFYRADFNYENGIHVEGLGSKGTTRGRHESIGSVEFEREKKGKYRGKIHIDVDLYKGGLGGFLGGTFFKHWGEVNFNDKHKRGTHPGDVVIQLEKRGVKTGVSCKRK